MEQYKRKLKLDNIFISIGIVILVAVQVLAFCEIIQPIPLGERWTSFWNGFIAGAALGITILLVVGLIINIRALRDEAKLKKLYIKSHDERAIEVAEKGRAAGASISVIAMLVVGIVSGFFSITVFVSVMSCCFVSSVIMAICKLYYNKKI